MRDHPCFSCSLPDCDDRSPDCIMRRLSNCCDQKRRHGEIELITDEEREANNFMFKLWWLERTAQAAEGVRPFNRGKPKAAERVPAP